MAIVAGNNLTDLSRASLAEEGGRRQFFLSAADMARLAAAERERNRIDETLGMGDLAARGRETDVRRELALAPWNLGATPAQKAAVDLDKERIASAERMLGRRLTTDEKIALADQAERRHATDLGYAANMADVYTRFGLGSQGLSNQLADINSRRDIGLANVGVNMTNATNAYGLGKARIDLESEAINRPYKEMTMPQKFAAGMQLKAFDLYNRTGGESGIDDLESANYANQLIDIQKSIAIGSLASDLLDESGTPIDRDRKSALDLATKIAAAVDSNNTEELGGLGPNEYAAARKYAESIDRTRGEIISNLGQNNLIWSDGRYVTPRQAMIGGAVSQGAKYELDPLTGRIVRKSTGEVIAPMSAQPIKQTDPISPQARVSDGGIGPRSLVGKTASGLAKAAGNAMWNVGSAGARNIADAMFGVDRRNYRMMSEDPYNKPLDQMSSRELRAIIDESDRIRSQMDAVSGLPPLVPPGL